jgi:hypothetical protein
MKASLPSKEQPLPPFELPTSSLPNEQEKFSLEEDYKLLHLHEFLSFPPFFSFLQVHIWDRGAAGWRALNYVAMWALNTVPWLKRLWTVCDVHLTRSAASQRTKVPENSVSIMDAESDGLVHEFLHDVQ